MVRRWLVVRALYDRDSCLSLTIASAFVYPLRLSLFRGPICQIPISEICTNFSEWMYLDGHRPAPFDSLGA